MLEKNIKGTWQSEDGKTSGAFIVNQF